MRIDEITKRETELIRLCADAKDASKQFAEACQDAALAADTSPAVVRRYIAALASEKANTVARETEQLVMLFNAIPTVSSGVSVSVIEQAA